MASSGTCGDNLTWTLDDSGTLTISGTGAMTEYGYQKFPWESMKNQIHKLVIEEGVTSIGGYAFYGYTNMNSCIISNTLVSIGPRAFENCTGLQNFTLPISLNATGENSKSSPAFMGCTNITNIHFTPGTGEGYNYILTGSPKTGKYTNTPWYYSGAATSKHITIIFEEGVNSIGNYTFFQCKGIRVIVLSDTITNIKTAAFSNCTQLATIYNASSLSLSKNSTSNGYVAKYANTIYTCHTITLQPNDPAIGSVSDSKIYIVDGKTPTIRNNTISTSVPSQSSTATPIDSSKFTGWSGVSGPVTSNITVIAIFDSSGPVMHIKVNGAWTEGKPFVKVNGAWKEATKVYIKVNGAWKESK